MTEVHIERAVLSEGTALVFKDYGTYVRMAYNPSRLSESHALRLMAAHIPRLVVIPQSTVHRVSVLHA